MSRSPVQSSHVLIHTVFSLKQGVARLIRSTTDRGVITILDPRLRTKSYGRDFLNSLPRMRITSELEDVTQIFNN